MEPLDLSGLSHDQLIELFRAVCAEAARRGAATSDAAQAAWVDEAERARIAGEAERETAARLRREEEERIRRDAADRVVREAAKAKTAEAQERERLRWGRRKGIAQAVLDIFERANYRPDIVKDLKIEAWAKNADVRVYIGIGFNENRIEYHHTGNAKHAPRTLKLYDRDFNPMRAEVAQLCEAIVAWAGGAHVKFMAREAIGWDGDAIPLAGYVPPQAAAPTSGGAS